jgi:zinc protease
VEEALLAEIDRVRQDPVSAEELATAQKQARALFAFSSESASNMGFWLGFSEIVADTCWFFGYLDGLAAVTAEDVQRLAQHYLADTRCTIGHYVPLDL